MDKKCMMCGEKDIEMKKRPLCLECYRKCLATGTLKMFPSKKPIHDTIMRKYGEEFFTDLESLETKTSTLKSIGDKYGITRERVRQIYYELYGVKYTSIIDARKAIRENNRIFLQGIEQRVTRAKPGCGTFKGIMAEYLFYKKCKELGYDVLMRGFGCHMYDCNLNGYRVDIKSCSSSKKTSSNTKQEYYHFGMSKSQKKLVDFIALYIYPENSWYILPRSDAVTFIPRYAEYGNGRYQELQQYRDAWHLLEGNMKFIHTKEDKV